MTRQGQARARVQFYISHAYSNDSVYAACPFSSLSSLASRRNASSVDSGVARLKEVRTQDDLPLLGMQEVPGTARKPAWTALLRMSSALSFEGMCRSRKRNMPAVGDVQDARPSRCFLAMASNASFFAL
jgi:hypothetical protein